MLRAAGGGEATAVTIVAAAGGRYAREFLPASRERRPQAACGRAFVVAAGGGGVGPAGAAALNLARSQAGLGEHGPVTRPNTRKKKNVRLFLSSIHQPAIKSRVSYMVLYDATSGGYSILHCFYL